MINTITGVLISPDEGTAKKITIEKSLTGYYRALNCDCIDIFKIKIGGEEYCVVCDDEGALKPDPLPSAFDKSKKPMLVGRLFVCRAEDDDLRSLDDEEAVFVMVRTIPVIIDSDNFYIAINNAEWL